jgi:hypothetical protein
VSIKLVYENFDSCNEDFVEGIEHLKARAMPKAIRSFRLAYESVDRTNVYRNKYESFCGLSRVLSGDSEGLKLCREAAKNEHYDGDVYLNLARAELYLKHRKNTVVTLKKGLQIDKRHPGLRIVREALGVRKRSPLPFLPRSHHLNHSLGKIMRKLRA